MEMSAPTLPYRITDQGIVLALRVMPRSGMARIDGLGQDSDGNGFLKLRVSEVAEKGKANNAVIKLLAKEWKLPRSALNIVTGATDRNKRIEILGNPQELSKHIERWCQETGIGKSGTEAEA